MELYQVLGSITREDDSYGEFAETYHYGIFSTLEKATEICNNLSAMEDTNGEEFNVERLVLDEPTELYDFMINN